MRKRILWVSILITFLGLLVFSFVSTEIYYNMSVEHCKETLRVYMNGYDERVAESEESVAAFSEKLGGARVTVMKLDGTVLGDSATDASSYESHANRPEVIDAIKDGEGFDIRSSDTLGKDMIYYCKKQGDMLVRIAVFTSSEWAIYGRSLPTIAAALLIDAFFCLVFTYIATRFMLHPVEELTRQARRGKTVESKYEELKPIADILNERNARIQGEMEKLEQEKELVERAKESKDELVANITHEMNTPLTSIKGFSELLVSGNLDEAQRNHAAEIILRQSERLTGLIAEIIHYSEIDNDELPSYDVDFSALAVEALKAFEPNMQEKNITLYTDIAEGITVFSRLERLTTIFNNLVANAVRYNKENGEIRVCLQKEGEYAKLTVSDTGIGIEKENLDKIFSRFFTVDKSHSGKNGGFGLGLAVVKKLCKKAGWTLAVESEPNKGTTFTVTF